MVINTLAKTNKEINRSSLVGQWVKDPSLSLQQLGLLLWFGFSNWLGNFHMLLVQSKNKKRKSKSFGEFKNYPSLAQNRQKAEPKVSKEKPKSITSHQKTMFQALSAPGHPL